MIARVGTALAWLAAGIVAVAVLRRFRRGRNVVLTGRFSPRFLRMVTIALVMFGVGRGDDRGGATPAGAPPFDLLPQEPRSELPPTLGIDRVMAWVRHQRQPFDRAAIEAVPRPSSREAMQRRDRQEEILAQAWWHRLKLAVTAGTWTGKADSVGSLGWTAMPTLEQILRAEIGAADKPRPLVPPRVALRALDELEAQGIYDLWLVSYLWRRTATTSPTSGDEAADRIELYARLHQSARLTTALIAAHAQMKSIMDPPPVWISKGRPPMAENELQIVFERAAAELLDRVKKLYPLIDAGDWQRDGRVLLAVAEGSPTPTLIRDGQRLPTVARQPLRIDRLDLIATAAGAGTVLVHASLGRIELPADHVVGVHELPSLLTADATAAVRTLVQTALGGDEQAALDVERALPLAHTELRAALARAPAAAGAPRLRLILALFDDVPMPVIPQPPEPGGDKK